MDSITQAVLGASIQGAVLGRWQGRKALLYGAMLGTLPDMDVLLDYGDAVANMTYHRGFSHSLFVLTGVSLLLTWLIRRFKPHADYSAGRLLLCIGLILFTHVLLDAFTSYGTQLFWPLTTQPVAISSIFIIDPLYTLPLLGAVAIAVVSGMQPRARRMQHAALLLSSLYLASTLVGKHMADNRLQEALTAAGINAEQTFTTPTPFNTLLWRVVAVAGDDYHEGLVSWFDHQPPQLEQLPRRYTEGSAALHHSPQYARLRWFAGDMLRYDLIDNQWVVTDLRLGMTGYHPFRFALASTSEQGDEIKLVEQAENWPRPAADLTQLGALQRRIFNTDYPLSLREMAASLDQPPGSTKPY